MRQIERDLMLVLLAVAAGSADGWSYFGLGHAFVANMTGNTVLLAVGLAQFDPEAVVRSSLALAGFVGGAALGAWIVERDLVKGVWPRPVTLALTVEAVILGAFAAGWQWFGDASAAAPTAILIVLSAFAMGLQSAAIRRLEVSGIATTYITGTLTNLVARVMRSRTRNSNSSSRHGVLLGAVWIVYFGGAAAAGMDLRISPWLALALPVAVVVCVVVIAAIAFRAR